MSFILVQLFETVTDLSYKIYTQGLFFNTVRVSFTQRLFETYAII